MKLEYGGESKISGLLSELDLATPSGVDSDSW